MLRGIAVLGVVLLHAYYWQYTTLALGPWGPWARRFVSATQPGWMGVTLYLRALGLSDYGHTAGLQE
jgi:peptidoglycan/LPS O-acetylase OafA/YrhL